MQNTIIPSTKNTLFHSSVLLPLSAINSYWPKMSPKLGFVAQIPIKIPLPLRGNQLHKIAKLTAQAND